MNRFPAKVIGDKKEWKKMEARARALPRDYRVVYGGINHYMFRFTSGDGRDIVAVLKDVLDLFESGAAENKHALDLTGEDVAAFCDDRLRGVPSYTDRWRRALNRDVANKLGHAGGRL